MKPHLLTISLLLFSFCNTWAQKENNIWLGGDSSGINFNSGSAVPFLRKDNIDFFRTNASICDTNGNLLFYTNGYYVYNRNYQLMQNGNALNIGDYKSFGYDLLSIADGAAIVPIPGEADKYYLFHVDLNYVSYDTFTNILMPTHLFYDIVDMSEDGNLGAIVSGQKDIVILSDTLTGVGFKIIKHANGRDYWLITHKMNSDVYYRFLIDPYGIHGPYTQNIGYVYANDNGLGFSILVFNKTATMAAQLSCDSTSVQLYNFDRCTGEFFNLIDFKVSDTSYQTIGGAFSPDGRYFYATAYLYYIWQFDLTAPDIFNSRKLIAVYDGAMNPGPTDFYEMRLGPDDKIYIHSYDWEFSIHVIDNPDSAGAACGFVENAIQVNPPGYDWNSFPNTVNYSLGALPGACDTLNAIQQLPTPVFTWSAYPNPFTEQLNISITGAGTNAVVEVYNLLGEKLSSTLQEPNNYFVHSNINLSSLAPGMYIIKVQVNGREYERKVVKE